MANVTLENNGTQQEFQGAVNAVLADTFDIDKVLNDGSSETAAKKAKVAEAQ